MGHDVRIPSSTGASQDFGSELAGGRFRDCQSAQLIGTEVSVRRSYGGGIPVLGKPVSE